MQKAGCLHILGLFKSILLIPERNLTQFINAPIILNHLSLKIQNQSSMIEIQSSMIENQSSTIVFRSLGDYL